MFHASGLFEKGKLPLGQAADLVELLKLEFMELLRDYDVSIFNYPPSDLENDINNAKNFIIWYKLL
jgi:predicted HTH domain antitoxin